MLQILLESSAGQDDRGGGELCGVPTMGMGKLTSSPLLCSHIFKKKKCRLVVEQVFNPRQRRVHLCEFEAYRVIRTTRGPQRNPVDR